MKLTIKNLVSPLQSASHFIFTRTKANYFGFKSKDALHNKMLLLSHGVNGPKEKEKVSKKV